jgi:hypothetical protein
LSSEKIRTSGKSLHAAAKQCSFIEPISQCNYSHWKSCFSREPIVTRINEYLMLQQMFQGFGGGTLAWSYAVYLAGMFVVLLWRKENIVSWGLYRASYLLFAGALALPPVITPVLSMTMSGVMGRGGMGQADVSVLFTIFSSGLGPALPAQLCAAWVR